MRSLFQKLGRKYTTSIVGALLVGLNKAFDFGLDSETVWQVVAILSAWILGEAVIDAAAAVKNPKKAA